MRLHWRRGGDSSPISRFRPGNRSCTQPAHGASDTLRCTRDDTGSQGSALTCHEEPGPEHLPVLVRQIMTDILAEQGLDARWMRPLDEVEMNALAEAWPGGSLRTLRRMIEAVLTSRNTRH